MYLYHYAAKGNTVERDGILSFARNPNADLFAIDINALDEANQLKAVYLSPSVMDIPSISDAVAADEVLCKLPDVQSIDTSPIDWSVCDDSIGRRFAYVRYYLLIVKDGIIPPCFIKKLPATPLTA